MILETSNTQKTSEKKLKKAKRIYDAVSLPLTAFWANGNLRSTLEIDIVKLHLRETWNYPKVYPINYRDKQIPKISLLFSTFHGDNAELNGTSVSKLFNLSALFAMRRRLQRDIMKFIGVDRSQTLVADQNRDL